MKWKEPKQLSDVSVYPELIICKAYQFTLILKTSNWVRLDTKKVKCKTVLQVLNMKKMSRRDFIRDRTIALSTTYTFHNGIRIESLYLQITLFIFKKPLEVRMPPGQHFVLYT